ncbi:MAG: hypothetical protein LBF38_03530 [Deltaproteobacteria bacterium]|jgi:hypothetical protein|nr:hypothetical protein [Deltaproteobacteria bacterium]
MGILFGNKKEPKPWDQYKKRSRGKGRRRGGGQKAFGGGWQDSQKNQQVMREASAKKEQVLLEAQKDSVLVHDPEDRPKSLPGKRFFSVLIMCLVFVLSIMVLVGLEIRHVRLGLEVSKLTNRKVALTEQKRHLLTELDKTMVVGDMEQVARESLGLVSPADGQIVIIP